MRVAIDGNEANIKNRVGVNQYAFNILLHLYQLSDDTFYTVFLKEKPLPDMPKEILGRWEYKVLPSKPLWVVTVLTPHLLVNHKAYDILFSPSHYTTPISIIPRVISIMDLGYLETSGQFKRITYWQLKYWTAISVYVSKCIIAISEATKKDIVRHYPASAKKIVVTLLSHDKNVFKESFDHKKIREVKNKYTIGGEYLLYLGTLKPSKNVENLIRAFATLLHTKSYEGLKLVVSGKKGWMFESIFKLTEELGLQNDIVFTDYVTEDEKVMLIHGAKAVVSPSKWEGFGLHVLEAMACGTPVITTNVGSFPEVIGDAGIVVDTSAESIADGIIKVLEMNAKDYNKLKQSCIRQAKKFDWEKTAEETYKVLRITYEGQKRQNTK